MKLPGQAIRLSALISGVFAMLVLSGCTAQYVSRYDAVTEAGITKIQRDVEQLLQGIERGIGPTGATEAAYENFIPVYAQLKIDAALLNTRAQAIDLNSVTAQQTQLLSEWIDNLEQLHQTGITSPALVAVPRRQAEQIFVAMLKFELAKKRQFDSPIIDAE